MKSQIVELNREFLECVKSDTNAVAKDFVTAKSYIKNSSAIFTRGNLLFLVAPKFFDKVAYEMIKSKIAVLDSILDKVISQYLEDIEFRKFFGFCDILQDLILLQSGYTRKLPIARIDIFLNEETLDFKFCEFNADGASAMNEDRELGNAWAQSSTWLKFAKSKTIKRFELFDSWVQEFDSLYSEYLQTNKLKRPKKPTIAIVDFLDIGTKSEFEVFRQTFKKHGFECIIEDITTLKFNKFLYSANGIKIDAVYRRAVTSECMQKLDSIKDFLAAVKSNVICLIGHFRTQIIHDKNLFRILRLPYTKRLLSDVQNAFVEQHIPKTLRLIRGEFDYDEIIADKDKWLIKPADRYGSQGVATGGDYSIKEWQKLIDNYIDSDFVLQEYCPPFKTLNMYFDDQGNQVSNQYNNMTGIYLYNGKVAGLYSRQMLGRVTTKQDEGRVTVSVLVES
ncbi:MAG: glutathionylspermidine synthase family protein [Clostridiales bacterium]|jgi:glutathionylspermidine synthase|nr:glutathionylspermidine synthase family protein [Clostridiales bacterium]